MIYVDFEAGNKNYRLRLTTRNTVALEKQIGCSPLAIFGDGDAIPQVTTMVAILNASLQSLNHGLTINDAYDIFDDWLADGHNITDFISVILDIYRVSGIIPDNSNNEEEKN